MNENNIKTNLSGLLEYTYNPVKRRPQYYNPKPQYRRAKPNL